MTKYAERAERGMAVIRMASESSGGREWVLSVAAVDCHSAHIPVRITSIKPQKRAETTAAVGWLLKPVAETAPPTAAETRKVAIPMGRVSVAGSGERRQRAAETAESSSATQRAAVAPRVAFLDTVKKSGVSDAPALFFFLGLCVLSLDICALLFCGFDF